MELLIGDEKQFLPLCVYVMGFGKAGNIYSNSIMHNLQICIQLMDYMRLMHVCTASQISWFIIKLLDSKLNHKNIWKLSVRRQMVCQHFLNIAYKTNPN